MEYDLLTIQCRKHLTLHRRAESLMGDGPCLVKRGAVWPPPLTPTREPAE
jgi:hypothetical protein